MLDCKLTTNYFRERNRMTNDCIMYCFHCTLSSQNNGTGLRCKEFEAKHPEKAIEIVQAWSNANPIKTYLSDFLEKFPNAKQEIVIGGYCVNNIYFGKLNCFYRVSGDMGCTKCWNRPLEEEQETRVGEQNE